MAVGDAYIKAPASVANGAYLDLQPAVAIEVIVHNVYVPENTAIEVYYYDGTDTIKVRSDNGSLYDVAMHCTEAAYVRVKNVSGSSAIFAADGITTLEGDVPIPRTISGLTAWWDFSDATTLFTDTGRTAQVVSDGDVILGVTDLSMSGNHLARSSGGPLYDVGIQNGLSVGAFDATVPRYLQCANLDPADLKPSTVFYAQNNISFAAFRQFIGGQSGTTAYALRLDNPNGKQTLDKEGTANILTSTNGFSTATAGIGCTTYGSAGACAHYKDGVANGTATNNQTFTGTGLNLFAGASAANPWHGPFFELLIYNSELSTADLNTVGAYLADKWALTWTGL